MYLLVLKFRVFLEFCLLLNRVAPYYILLPRTVWLQENITWLLLKKSNLFRVLKKN